MKFSEEKRKEYLKNPYVVTLSKDHIIYTEDFRKKVILEVRKGKKLKDIYIECNFNPLEIELNSIKTNYQNWSKQFSIIEENGEEKAIRIKGAYPKLGKDGKIRYITVEGGNLVKDYTQKEVDILKNNEYVEYVDLKKITFTDEFKKKFISELKSNKTIYQIFSDYGLDPNMIGKRRIKTCTRRWKKQAKVNPNFDKKIHIPKTPNVKSETREIKLLQNKIKRLEMENEFLKKVQTLRKG